MSLQRTSFLTTAIDYTNGSPHIGHAYEKVLADVMSRYLRLRGKPVYFLTGVDQHGQKVQASAQKAGTDPETFVAEKTERFVSLWAKLGVAYDGWAATTDLRHQRVVQAILQRLYDEGQLYKSEYQGFYSVRQEQFLTDKERGPDGEFGPEWGEVVEIEEANYYFRLKEHGPWLIGLLDKRPDLVYPASRQQELRNAVERLGEDLCISRPKDRLSWGIPFPFDPEYVTFVWFDALVNYISFAGYLKEEVGTPKPGEQDLPTFEELWPPLAHVIGKDILIPAHGVYWYIMLHALGFSDDQMPPLLVHGFWNSGGARMSKSVGNVADPHVLADQYGAEAVRYFLSRDISTGQDADFSEDRLVQRFNTDLANDLGNLLNRTLNMAGRYREGRLRAVPMTHASLQGLADELHQLPAVVGKAFDGWRIHEGLEAIIRLVSRCNGVVDELAPWKLAKDPEAAELLDEVLYALAEALRIFSVLLSPVIPRAAEKMLTQLGCPAKPEWSDAVWRGEVDTWLLGEPEPVFPRILGEEEIARNAQSPKNSKKKGV